MRYKKRYQEAKPTSIQHVHRVAYLQQPNHAEQVLDFPVASTPPPGKNRQEIQTKIPPNVGDQYRFEGGDGRPFGVLNLSYTGYGPVDDDKATEHEVASKQKSVR